MRPSYTLIHQFTSRPGTDSLYNWVVTLEIKPPVILIASLILIFVALIAVLLWALPGERRPFDYMVAGTFATAITLVALFLFTLKRR